MSDQEQSMRCDYVLPRIVDGIASEQPNRKWMTIPHTSNLNDGWRDIAFSELSHAINGFARWIEHEVGCSDGNGVMAYMGVSDQLYAVVIVGLMKAGYQALLLSPRNSPEGQASLIDQTECKVLLHGIGVDALVRSVDIAVPELPKFRIPSFDELCQQGVQNGPYAGGYDESEMARALIMHTSGSTGLPKAINVTNGALATVVYHTRFALDNEIETCPARILGSPDLVLTITPFFHAMGIAMLARSILCQNPIMALPPGQLPSVEVVLRVLEEKIPWGAFFVPSLLEDISGTARGMEILAKMGTIFYGGAPLSADVGLKIGEHTNVYPVLGSTEAFACVSLIGTSDSEFGYFEWAPRSGYTMEPQDDGLYELVMKRGENPKLQAVFYNFPHLSEWRTKDLFQRHPTKPNLWKYECRKDDVLVLSNGEKFNPTTFERALESQKIVKSALVVGAGKFQPGLLIEPDWDLIGFNQDPTSIIEELWPIIEVANDDSPGHGRVWKSKVAIARKDRPFKRAPKGTVIRGATINTYGAEIDALYSNEVVSEQLGRLEEDADLDTIRGYLQRATTVAGMKLPEDVSASADIFSFGVDSLQVLALSSILSNARGGDKKTAITARDIYTHSTLGGLTALLYNGNDSGDDRPLAAAREQAMQAMVDGYTHDLPNHGSVKITSTTPDAYTIILTGSTGSLGSYILQELLDFAQVTHVYCFNRSADAGLRQKQTFASRGYVANLDKVTFLHTDTSQDRFELSEDLYTTLLSSVNVIFHNAWAVDFNKTLTSFESVHVAGTRRLVDFSIASQYRAKIVFMSSIASVGNWISADKSDDKVPERVINEHSAPLPQGYGESKHVAELILATAAERSGVPVTIVRAGQLAGPSDGLAEWNRHEWVPSLVLTSQAMGILPERLGSHQCIDWVPMDWAAKSVWELARAERSQEGARVSHLVNPSTNDWSNLVPVIRQALGGDEQIKIVSYDQWVKELEDVSMEKDEIEKKPAVKLLEFFQGLTKAGSAIPGLATEETAELSGTVKDMRPIDESMMRSWIEQWLA